MTTGMPFPDHPNFTVFVQHFYKIKTGQTPHPKPRHFQRLCCKENGLPAALLRIKKYSPQNRF
jgi:hypothetical protein